MKKIVSATIFFLLFFVTMITAQEKPPMSIQLLSHEKIERFITYDERYPSIHAGPNYRVMFRESEFPFDNALFVFLLGDELARLLQAALVASLPNFDTNARALGFVTDPGVQSARDVLRELILSPVNQWLQPYGWHLYAKVERQAVYVRVTYHF